MLLVVGLGVAAFTAFDTASAALDIRVSGLLIEGQDRTSYVVRVPDCRELSSIVIGSGTTLETRGVDAAEPAEGTACEFAFEATGAVRLTPTVTAHYADGSSETHTETFAVDDAAPALSLDGVSFVDVGGRQHLVVALDSSDDTDVSYVAVSAIGLRASSLRAAGGIVEQAKGEAFADSGGFVRVAPTADGVGRFTLTVPVGTLSATGEVLGELDAAAIGSDGLVLVEAHAVDSSGNQTSLSRIVLTGEGVDEAVNGLSVLPERILFTNLLEMATIVPLVDFQFRGPTPLPGSGSGVRYESTHPAIVAVTSSGLVYPLAETAGTDVRITVSYGAFSVEVPVEVDPSKSLVGLRLEGLDGAGRWVLPSLNERHPIPSVTGLFDDGTEAAVGSQFALDFVVDVAGSGIVELDPDEGVLASAAIGDGAPVDVTVQLNSSPSIGTTVPLVAIDALPIVSLGLPSRVGVGETLLIAPRVRDDVGIAEVRFFLDDEPIGIRSAPPFEVLLDIGETMRNETLRISAEATDTGGGVSARDEDTVRVSGSSSIAVPTVLVETPLSMERYIEGSPIRYQVSHQVGEFPERSAIAFVDFLVDGAPIGQSRYPIFENRCSDPVPDCYFEVWRFNGLVEEISTAETTRVFQAAAFGFGGTPTTTVGRPFLIAANQEPLAVILSPATGGAVTAGASVPVLVEIADDTLGGGVDIELLIDGVVAQTYRHVESGRTTGARVLARARHTFYVDVAASRLGTTFALQARATDLHGERALSGEVRL